MNIIDTSLKGVFLIEPRVFEDFRGIFIETYNKKHFNEAAGMEVDFVQDNFSRSKFGVLRGLHFQKPPFAQAKLVRVLEGEVWDVAVDIREGSPTFGQYFGTILSAENKKQLFIPRGFAHGFVVLSKTADFLYKCDNYYSPAHDSGIIYNDVDLNIDWVLKQDELILSEKDKILLPFKNIQNN